MGNFYKQTIRDVDVTGKSVLLRADFNVPLTDGKIDDDYRIRQALPTLKYLIERRARVFVCAHLGRPKTAADTEFSLKPVYARLRELLGKENVLFTDDCIGPDVSKYATSLHQGQILLLENLRFHPEEEKNDPVFAKWLVESTGAELFVQDGFGVVHRAHASTEGVTHLLPSVAGLLLEQEVGTINETMQAPKRPLVAVIGGAKISDKIDVLYKFIEIADAVAVGGAMANTFLKAEGVDVGESLYEPDDLPIAKDIIEKARARSASGDFVFYLPQDGVVASKIDKTAPTRIVDWSTGVMADVENYPKRPPLAAHHLTGHEMILDIGPFSAAFIAGLLQFAGTVVWNGSMGVAETPGLRGPVGPTAHGTDEVIRAIMGTYGHKPFSVVGGGDTVSYIRSRNMTDLFSHVSTGGGACIELMSGKKLPGIEALLDKSS